jgi:hypothetical protein
LQRLNSHSTASVIEAVIAEYNYEEVDYEDENVRNKVIAITRDVKDTCKDLFSIFIDDCNAEASNFSSFINLHLNEVELYKKMIDCVRVRNAIKKLYLKCLQTLKEEESRNDTIDDVCDSDNDVCDSDNGNNDNDIVFDYPNTEEIYLNDD